MDEPQFKLKTTDTVVLIQSFILGLLLGELWPLSKAIGAAIYAYIQIELKNYQVTVIFICFIIGLFIPVYFYMRGGFSDTQKLLKSKRLDLLALMVFGAATSFFVAGFGTSKYIEYVSKIDKIKLLSIVAIPVVFAVVLFLRALGTKVKALILKGADSPPVSFFLNDQAIESKAGDTLELGETATRFAERVLNGNSSDSLVFGIDAPWGTGKSSFINFCCEYWASKGNSKPIVLRFEPLRYKESEDLVDKLIHALIAAIQKEAFLPSINSLFSKYLSQTKGKKEFSFFGLTFKSESSLGALEETINSLENHLLDLDRKIIIVVDDLDRLSWNEVKNILFAIKRSFMLPNVSYILSFDTATLTSLKQDVSDDAEKVKEFLEKFVNIQIGLFLDTKVLARYVSSEIEIAINKNLQLEPLLLDQIRQTLDAVVDIYKSNEYVFYQDFIGDIRKVKRLINTMMLFEIQKTDFNNSDFNKHDLIHLLLVYINYPNIFRTIYSSETDGKSGFFSLAIDYISSQLEFSNSQNYKDFIKNLKNNNQKFLLNKLFDKDTLLSKLEHDQNQGDQELDIHTRACFNDSSRQRNNLERYLNLIVKLAKQDKRESYQFYVSIKNQLIAGKSISELFMANEFSFDDGDFARDQLWSVIANSARDISPEICRDVVIYLINNLPSYSFFDATLLGARSRPNLVYSLLTFLNEGGWGSGVTGRRNNTKENIAEIAEWIFGEREFANIGILSALSDSNRGALGLFDLLLFRLYCSADRNTSLFNLHRALSLHENQSNPTEGLTTIIAVHEMREISQRVFQIFLNQYIVPKRNIFEVIDNLSIDDFAGETIKFVKDQIARGKISDEKFFEIVEAGKSQVKSFIVYQLGNTLVGSGVGCGYYDEVGNSDARGIAKRFNKYLFGICFNPKTNQGNYERFLDYLLLNFTNNFFSDESNKYVASELEFTKVLDKTLLRRYWLKHRSEILALDLTSKNKRIYTTNYIASYNEDLKDVYRVLDGLSATVKESK